MELGRSAPRGVDALPLGRGLDQGLQTGMVGASVDQEIVDLVFVQDALPVGAPARHGRILVPDLVREDLDASNYIWRSLNSGQLVTWDIGGCE